MGRSLLDLAVLRNQQTVTERLMRHEFDTSEAINHAWTNYIENDKEMIKNTANEIILILLKSNSTIPNDFNYEKASQKVQEFVEYCEDIHEDVNENKFENLNTKLDKYPNMIYFYNRNNQSLLAHALENRNYYILKYLERGITIGPHEDIKDVYKNVISDNIANSLRTTNRQNSNENPESHLLSLRFKSRIGNNDQFSHQKWRYVNEAFENINANKYCSLILKVTAECKKLRIFFDFRHDSTYYMDPATSIFSRGIIYEGGSIFIGAKNLIDDQKKFEVFGVLIHELCHLAIYMTFMNRNFDPFSLGKSKEKKRFHNKVMNQCKDKQDCETLVKNVLSCYSESIQCSEMIVVAPQLMITYQNDTERVEDLRKLFSELFKYSEEVVEPELERALPVLKSLWGEKPVTFKDLTKPMKAKIWHAEINFQGVETTFYQLIGSDQEILEVLLFEDIVDILLKNLVSEIGETCELDLKYELSERSFINRDIEAKLRKLMPLSYKQELDKYSMNFEEIEIEARSKQIMILADFAGTGKTTIFKHYTKKLKSINENHWVSFINLRKCQEVFEIFDKISTTEQVLKLLLKILKPQSQVEVKIFIKLFFDGNVILLLDGFDEISQKYTATLLKIFKIWKEMNLSNELWISTRPHHVKELEDFFDVSAYKFKPFLEHERMNYINEILIKNDVSDDQEEIYKEISKFITKLEKHSFDLQSVDNSLIIQMITELYTQKAIKLDTSSRYELYLIMIKTQKEKNGIKIPNEDRDRLTKLSIWEVHQVLALMVIFGTDMEEKLGFKRNEMSIIKKWKKVSKDWTSKMIQQYGFVTVDMDALNKEENVSASKNIPAKQSNIKFSTRSPFQDSQHHPIKEVQLSLNITVKASPIDFIHRTYAEFFVAQFMIDFIFNDNGDMKEEAIQRKFMLFDAIMRDTEKLSVVQEFILSHIENEAQADGKVLDEDVQKLIFENILQIHKDFKVLNDSDAQKMCKYFKNYATLACVCPEIVEVLWKFEDSGNFLNFLIRKFSVSSKINNEWIIKSAELCFGSNWNEKFNRSDKALITDEEIEKFKVENEDEQKWKCDKNMLKISDLVDKNFESYVIYGFYKAFDISLITNFNIFKEISQKVKNLINQEAFARKCFKELNFDEASKEIVCYVLNIINSYFVDDPETLRCFLFKNSPNKCPALVQSFSSRDPEVFRLVKNFYLNYKIQNSWKEIQDIILDNMGIIQIINGVNSQFYSDFRDFIKEVFRSNNLRIEDELKNYFSDKKFFEFQVKLFKNLEDFCSTICPTLTVDWFKRKCDKDF
ncbi:hypothetical protein ACKWTF_003419 [Chironomus riparius]